MIVVAIIAIISAIAYPAYKQYISTSSVKEAHDVLNILEIAEEEFRLQTGSYFEGANTDELMTKSEGLWDINNGLASATAEAQRRFLYSVAPGTSGLNTSFQATATGKIGSTAEGVTCTLKNGENLSCN